MFISIMITCEIHSPCVTGAEDGALKMQFLLHRQNNYVSLPLILFEVNLIGVRTLLFLKDMR